MKRILRNICGLGFLSVLLMSAGCWDSKEVENLAVASIIGFDRVTVDGEDLWQFSTRILNMAKQQGSEGKEGAAAQETLLMGRGTTVQEALNEIDKRLPATFFFEQNVGFIIGERAAREELTNVISNALRFPSSRTRVKIFVCEGEAYKVLQTQPELSSTLSKELRKIADRTAEQSGGSLKMTVLDFSKQLLRKDRDAVLPLIRAYDRQEGEEAPEKSLKLEGFGVVREDKLVGWLKEEDALAYILSVGKPKKPPDTASIYIW